MKEPSVRQEGLSRFACLIVAIWLCRGFALWLDPLVAEYLIGRDIAAAQSYSAAPAKSQDRVQASVHVERAAE